MGRKKSVMKNLNEEKENNNPSVEYTNNTIEVPTNLPVVGEKRPIELVDLNNTDNQEIEIINLKKKCFDLEQRVEILEKTCLLIPQDMTAIENLFDDITTNSSGHNDMMMLNNNDFVTVANCDVVTTHNNLIPVNRDDVVTIHDNLIPVNRDDVVTIHENLTPVNHDHNVTTMGNGEKTADVLTTLSIDDVTLRSLKSKTATSTARAILKYLYPNPEKNFKLSNMNKTVVDEIVDHVNKVHPGESTTKAKIKHAMSNYFGLFHYKKKNKSTISN